LLDYGSEISPPLGIFGISTINHHSLHGSAELLQLVRATRLVNGTPRYLDPQKSETPEPIDIKLDRGDYVGDLTPHANFGISALNGGGSAYA